MSTATPTLIPRGPIFPNVLPMAPQPHTVPHAPYGYPSSRIARRRELQREMNDLSEEEGEMEELVCTKEICPTRGLTFVLGYY